MVHALHPLFAALSIVVSFRSTSGTIPGNTSVLPPGWGMLEDHECLGDGGGHSPRGSFLFGPNFTDPIGLTIELCVNFCNKQGSRMAGLVAGTECRCSNIFNPFFGFEADPDNDCELSRQSGFGTPCPGNENENCGSEDTDLMFYNFNSPFNCSFFVWPGGAALAPSGGWRFSYFYNDSISARALPHTAVTLPAPLPRGNLTVAACVTACEDSGFSLAGVEFGAECFCGNALESNSQPITDCSLLPPSPFTDSGSRDMLMPCSGNPSEFCGGPNIISIFTLPGTGLIPMISFDSSLDNFCSGFDCFGGE